MQIFVDLSDIYFSNQFFREKYVEIFEEISLKKSLLVGLLYIFLLSSPFCLHEMEKRCLYMRYNKLNLTIDPSLNPALDQPLTNHMSAMVTKRGAPGKLSLQQNAEALTWAQPLF